MVRTELSSVELRGSSGWIIGWDEIVEDKEIIMMMKIEININSDGAMYMFVCSTYSSGNYVLVNVISRSFSVNATHSDHLLDKRMIPGDLSDTIAINYI